MRTTLSSTLLALALVALVTLGGCDSEGDDAPLIGLIASVTVDGTLLDRSEEIDVAHGAVVNVILRAHSDSTIQSLTITPDSDQVEADVSDATSGLLFCPESDDFGAVVLRVSGLKDSEPMFDSFAFFLNVTDE